MFEGKGRHLGEIGGQVESEVLRYPVHSSLGTAVGLQPPPKGQLPPRPSLCGRPLRTTRLALPSALQVKGWQNPSLLRPSLRYRAHPLLVHSALPTPYRQTFTKISQFWSSRCWSLWSQDPHA